MRRLLGQRGGSGPGNSSYPAEVLLRCLLLGVWHDLSDPALETAIADRISFRRFAGLSLHDRTPDHSTLWRFRQELSQDGLVDRVFAEIARQLEANNLVLKRGVTNTDNLFDWFAKCSGDGFAGAGNKLERHRGAVTLMDAAGKAVRTWEFTEAYPVKWSGPKLAASARDLAVEELEVCHCGFTSKS